MARNDRSLIPETTFGVVTSVQTRLPGSMRSAL
jgi:hypothetical protein